LEKGWTKIQPDGGKCSSEAEWAKKHLLGKGVAKIQPDGGVGSSEAGWTLIQPDANLNL
jgi:hypothetical protein